MKQYLDLLKNILNNGREKESGRTNMPNTIGISGAEIKMDIEEGFPLLTTKEMYWKGIIHELLWIIRGETNIKYLVDNNVNIWNGDAYRWYLKWWGEAEGAYTQEEFIEKIKEGKHTEYTKNNDSKNINWSDPNILSNTWIYYRLGDLGKIYGYQWRNQNGVDQLSDLIKGLQTNPFSRYHILNAWNKADFSQMALPPCHLLYQFIVRPLTKKEKLNWLNTNNLMYEQTPWTMEIFNKNHSDVEISEMYGMPRFYLDLNMYQRSCDVFLGVPFNLASMATFLMIMAQVAGMIPGVARWIGGDVHLYMPHICAAEEQIKRETYELPKLQINKNLKTIDDIVSLTISDFNLLGYHYHPKIKQELFTGYKK